MKALGLLCLLAGMFACDASEDEVTFTRDQLLDPETCLECHPSHYQEWQSSMHAYAADDPIFLAMNARGQRESGGELGDFCVQCHAPMALREGATTDGLNLGELPQKLKGVTCYFCHNVDAVVGTHNNPLRLANDLRMRGAISDPVPNEAHLSGYAALQDRNTDESAEMCGACHDIVNPGGLHIERTFVEWQDSVFNTGTFGQTCSECHMPGTSGIVADLPGVPFREKGNHSHLFPAVDIPITPWPGIDTLRAANENEHKSTVSTKVCYNPVGNTIDVSLTNIGAGHMFPSGAAPDRRAFVELVAELDGEVILSSGVAAEGEPIASLSDPNLWQIRDFLEKDDGSEAHMFWQADVLADSPLLPPATTFDRTDPGFDHSVLRQYPLGNQPRPSRIEVQVKLRPFGLDIIDDLIESGDLDPSVRGAIETFSYEGSRIEWTPERAGTSGCVDALTR